MTYQINISLPDDLGDDLKAYAASYNGVGVSISDAVRILLRKGIDIDDDKEVR